MRPADSLGETSADIRATMQPPALRIPFRHLLVIVLAQVLALVAQAWLSRVLLAQGYEELQAHYLAYLVVPPVLLVSLAPVLLEHREFLLGLFRPRRLTVPLALAAVALGVTMRIVWWASSSPACRSASPGATTRRPPSGRLFPGTARRHRR